MPTAVSALFSAERLPEGAAAALDRAVLELIRTAAFDSWLNRYIMYGRRCANEGSVSEPSSEGRLSATQMRGRDIRRLRRAGRDRRRRRVR